MPAAKSKTARKKLTGPREKFCRLVADGANPSKAYRAAYPKAKPSTSWTNSYELLRNTEVKQRIAELKRLNWELCEASKEELMQTLVEVIRTPIGDIDESSPLCQEHTVTITKEGNQIEKYRSIPKLQAIERLCKMCGWDEAEKIEQKIEQSGPTPTLQLFDEDKALLDRRDRILEKALAESGHKRLGGNGAAGSS